MLNHLAEQFFRVAVADPDRVALRFESRQVSYAELASQVQHWLSLDPRGRLGRIGWCARNHPDLAVLYLGCVASGRELVLFEPGWPDTVRQRMLRRVDCDHVYHVPAVSALCARPIATDTAVTASPAGNFLSYPFLISFTSGSTGDPRAIRRSQQSWLSSFRASATEFCNAAAGRVLAPGPLSHGLSFYAMAETLHAGGQFLFHSRFDAEACRIQLRNGEVDSLVLVPTLLDILLDDDLPSAGFPNVSRLIVAGSKLSPRLRERALAVFPGCTLSEYYGASELSFVSVAHSDEGASATSVGRAFTGVVIAVLNPDGQLLPNGIEGLVGVRSDGLADGYLDQYGVLRPLRTLAGWTTVGDVGVHTDGGWLTLIDRADNQLSTGGLNIYPAVIERVLNGCFGVAESMVLGRRDERWGDRVCAVLREAAPGMPTLNQLRNHCQQQLSTEQIPREWYRVERWPLTGTGKLCRQTVQCWLNGDHAALERIDA